MSDVSGIPYMGPMGQGNFFAPQFSYNPQMSAAQISSPYMPEIYNNQNVVNNLFNTGGGMGGFGKATDYYSALGASYLAQVPSSWENPYAHGAVVPQSLRVEGGNYADLPSQVGSVFNQGAVNNFITGGGGYNFPSISGPGGGGGQQQPMDWGSLFGQSVGGMGGGNRDPYPGMSMPGGLNSPMTMPQQQPSDYGSLFGQGAGGMGGAPQPSPYTSGIEPDQTGGRTYPGALDAPMEGAPSSAMDWSTLFSDSGGMSMPGGLNSPMTMQEPAYDYGSLYGKGTEGAPQPEGTRTYDFAPMFEGGGGGGFGTGGAETSQLFGGGNAGSLGGDAFDYNPAEISGAQDIFPQSAEAMAEQARARLASLIGGDDRPIELKVEPQDKVPAEVPAATPTEAPAEAPAVTPGATTPATDLYPGENPPRPPADMPQVETRGERQGMVGKSLAGVDPKLVAAVRGGATFLPPGYRVEAYSGVRNSPTSSQGYHRHGNAVDIQIIDPSGRAISNEGADTTGMYTKLAQGVKTWVTQNDPETAAKMGYGGAFGTKIGGGGVPDLMHYDLGGSRGNMRPEVQFDRLQPLTAEEQRASLGSQIQSGIAAEAQRYAEGPSAPLAERSADATVETRPGVNQGQAISSPPADIPPAGLVGPGYNALDAAANAPPAPVKHSGLELARANIDTPIEQIARERFGQKGVDEVSSMVKGMTPRQIYESYGGMFTSRAEPLFKGLGITRQDFEKAATMPQAKQDLKMRFGEGDFGPYPDYTGPEAVPGGTAGWALPMPSTLHPDITDERGLLAQAMQPEDNVVGPTNSAFNFDPGGYGEGGYGNVFEPTYDEGFNALDAAAGRNTLAKRMDFSGFSPSPEPRQGGVGPQMEQPTLEHMRTMAQIESTQNPNLHDKGSSYKGLYQLSDPEFRKYGGQGSIFDPEQNTKAASAKMMKEGQQAQDVLGRALTPVEQYMVHQQGLAGTLSHLANPEQPAWKSWQQAASSSEAKAKQVIWGNLSPAMKAQFGSVDNITSRDFIDLWNTKYYQKMVESGLSPGGLSDLP